MTDPKKTANTDLAKLFARPDEAFAELLRHLERREEAGVEDATKATQPNQPTDGGARALVELSEWLAHLKISALRLRKVGAARFLIIAPYLTAEIADGLLNLAGTHSTAELKEIVRAEAPHSRRRLLVDLNEKAFEVVAAALVRHGATRSGSALENAEAALMNLARAGLKTVPSPQGLLNDAWSIAPAVNRFVVRVDGSRAWSFEDSLQAKSVLDQALNALLRAGKLDLGAEVDPGQAIVRVEVLLRGPLVPDDGLVARQSGFISDENPFPPRSRKHAEWAKSYEQDDQSVYASRW